MIEYSILRYVKQQDAMRIRTRKQYDTSSIIIRASRPPTATTRVTIKASTKKIYEKRLAEAIAIQTNLQQSADV